MKKIIGIVLVAIALLRLASMWGIYRLDWSWLKDWGEYIIIALLIYVGVKLIVSSYRRNPDQWLRRPLPLNEDGKRICCNVSFGGDEYVYQGQAFHGARLDAFFGGIRLDLREAVITEDEEIDIHTFMGGVELLVPADVRVEVKSHSFIGGVGNHTECNAPADAPCIHIIASNFFGGVSVI